MGGGATAWSRRHAALFRTFPLLFSSHDLLPTSLLLPRWRYFPLFSPSAKKKREREKEREEEEKQKKSKCPEREREREAAAAFDSNQFPFDIFFPSLAPLFLTIFICIFPPLSLSLSLFFGSLVNVSPFCFVRIKGDSGSLNTDSISNC